MKLNKYLLIFLSILILFVFITQASAADANSTDTLSTVDNNEILSIENDVSNYSELSREIGSGGQIELQHDYYRYDTGNTIEISVDNSFINGKGAVIDMAGSTIQTFYITGKNVVINNLTIKNVNYGSFGGAIDWRSDNGTVNNCAFINNTAASGGAIYWRGDNGAVSNCTFINNTANRYGGAINWWSDNGAVSNCTFINNTADYGGAIYWEGDNSTISNSNFVNNTAMWGSAIRVSKPGMFITNSSFLNNFGKSQYLMMDKKDKNIEILFGGYNDLLNAIYAENQTVNFANVTYWGANGITNTDIETPINSFNEAGQNITITVVVNDNLVLNTTKITNADGKIILDSIVNVTGKYEITGRHNSDSYYTEIEQKLTFTEGNQTNLNLSISGQKVIAEITPIINGNITFTVENKTGIVRKENITLNNGIAELDLTGLYGKYNVTAVYAGNDTYWPCKTNITIDIPKIEPEITIELSNMTEEIIITLPSDAKGNITVKVDNMTVNTTDVTTSPIIIPINVTSGNHTVEVIYSGDDKYLPCSNSTIINVPKIEPEITIELSNMTEEIIITLPSDAKGNITVKIDDETYNVPINDGVAVLNISDLASGLHNVTVTYSGDEQYASKTVETIINNTGDSIIINAPNVVTYYHSSERFIVTVTNAFGVPIAGKTVNMTINGVSYLRVSDNNGTVSIPLNLNSGVYDVTVVVDNITVKSLVTILSTVDGYDIVKMYRNATQYYATFIDTNGKYLADGIEVKFNINGIEYVRKITGGKGQAGLNINLPQGEYVITAINPVNGEMHANNITVLPTVVDNKDITKYYRNGTQYSVKALGADGKVVGKGEIVTFNINGVFYNRTTDENGIATLNINLPPSNYVITADYKGCRVANNITVLPVLNATDITMKYHDGTKFKANLVDGQGKPYKDQIIRFNINGKFYDRITDSNGQAALNINLPSGEYIITSTFNGCNVANKITVIGVL